MFVIKNYNLWVDLKDISNKREIIVYDAKSKFTKKSFGQTFVKYLALNANSMPLSIKKHFL